MNEETKQWVEGRAKAARAMANPYLEMGPLWSGKDIGHEQSFMFTQSHSWAGPHYGSAACLGILEGLFDLVAHDPFDCYGEAWVKVALTRKGMEYFGSTPRLAGIGWKA